MPTLKDSIHNAAIAEVKPHAFKVGGTWDGHKIQGGITYDRKWSNGFGLTAYARAWYYDKPIVPTERSGAAVGFEAEIPIKAR